MLNKNKRPKPVQTYSYIDLALGTGTLIVVGFTLFLTFDSYPELPKIIPTHFSATGVPDKFGHKTSIWFLPIVSLVLCAGLWILGKYPQYFNYLTEINEENAQRQYQLASKMVRVLGFLVSLVFLFATYETIQVSQNEINTNGSWHFFFTVFSFLIVLIIYIYKSNKKS